MGVEIVQQADDGGRTAYFLRHGYDLDIFTALPEAGPFASYGEAETAASVIDQAIASVGD